MKKGKLLVISGPSGAGKDTILHMFLHKHPDWVHVPSVTTRPMRPSEAEGVDYHFMRPEQFKKLIKQNKFLEWFTVTENLYGTLADPVNELLHSGKNVVLRKE